MENLLIKKKAVYFVIEQNCHLKKCHSKRLISNEKKSFRDTPIYCLPEIRKIDYLSLAKHLFQLEQRLKVTFSQAKRGKVKHYKM